MLEYEQNEHELEFKGALQIRERSANRKGHRKFRKAIQGISLKNTKEMILHRHQKNWLPHFRITKRITIIRD